MIAQPALEARLHGTRRGQVLRELLGNAAHFPIANLFYEAILEGAGLLRGPDAYVLVGACLLQAWAAGSWQHAGRPRPLLASLIGPLCYTVVEGLIEGPQFFDAPNHVAYWGFALAIGALQQAQQRAGEGLIEVALSLAEGLTRAGILMAMYWLLEIRIQAGGLDRAFFSDPSHVYIALALGALGLLVGLLHSHTRRSLRLLRDTAAQLRRFSEWAMGRDLLERAIADNEVLALRRETRGIVFADLRGFTAWSERQMPEVVVAMLNRYYAAVGEALAGLHPVKVKFSADEAMAVFTGVREAIAAARAMRDAIGPVLAEHGLGAGIGLHAGPTVEGLLGSPDVRLYDVIGDTANVAKRLCDQAAAGEILLGVDCARTAGLEPGALARRTLSVKGKAEPIEVCSL
jgi:class 3 adenylate cyclase